MKNLTWQNPEQLFVAQVLINKVKSKCCGIKVNQLGGNNEILRYLGNLSELTSHYMFFIEENMQESLKDTLEKSIASFHLKSNSELSKMLLAEFDMIENLQVCVLIKY